MRKKRINMQRLVAALLILLLLVSGCDSAGESISTEIPSPTATETPIPAPTITPTPGLPLEIITIFGEEVPELVKNEQGYYAESVRWKATYENGEWEVLPRPTTGFDQELLEAVKQDYVVRPDTPDTWEGVIADLKRNADYDPTTGQNMRSGTNTVFIRTHGLILPSEKVSLEGHSGFKHGDTATVGMILNSNSPDNPFPVLLGVNKDGEYIANAGFQRVGIDTNTAHILDEETFNTYVGKITKFNTLYYFRDKNWQEDKIFERHPAQIKEMMRIFESNPEGYLQKWTKKWVEGDTFYNGENIKNIPRIIEQINLEEDGDVCLIGMYYFIYT